MKRNVGVVAGGPFVLGVDAADEPCSLDERPAPRRRRARIRISPGSVCGEWQDIDDAFTQSQ